MSDKEIDINEYNALKRIVSELVYIARCQGWQFNIENGKSIINLCYQEIKKSPYEIQEDNNA